MPRLPACVDSVDGVDGVAEDWLLYRLAGPYCRVSYVRVAVYRALYQPG